MSSFQFYLLIVFLLGQSSLSFSQVEFPLYEHQIPNSTGAPDEEEVLDRGPNNRAFIKTSIPTLTVFTPEKPNGTAVIICVGGAYQRTAIDKEGVLVAQELIKAGVTVFVLKYRLPDDRWNIDKSLAPLQDAQQAIRWIRSHAEEYDLNPNQVGLLGFSAGGHLAASAANLFYENADPENIDSTSVRPDFVGLVYPVISFEDEITNIGSRNNLLGENPEQSQIEYWSMEKQVTPDSPPAFIIHCSSDEAVPVENSLQYFQSCKDNGVPVELHAYPCSGHGFGLYNPASEELWTDLFIDWLEQLYNTDYLRDDLGYNAEITANKIQEKYHPTALADEQSSNHYVQQNIIYTTSPRDLHLDLYRPYNASNKVLPTVLLIHGGGWKSGSKENLQVIASYLANKGFLVANIEYRLSDESVFPAAIEDAYNAMSFLVNHAEEYQVDVENFSLLGCSSGAQLASLLGTTYHKDIFGSSLPRDFKVASVINIDGILSFTHQEAKPEWTGKSATLWLGEKNHNQEKWIAASPLHYVDDKSPPFLFINSGIDRFHAGRDDFISILNSHNIQSETVTFEDAPHSFWFFEPWYSPMMIKCVDFLSMRLKRKTEG